MKPPQKIRWVALALFVAICLVTGWIYLTQLKSAWETRLLDRSLGETLAQSSSEFVGPRGRIVLLSIDSEKRADLKVQIQAFRMKLKELGNYELREEHINAKNGSPLGGLSGKVFLNMAKKHSGADLFVSFIGAPALEPGDIAELGNKAKLVTTSISTDNLADLFKRNLLLAAVVPQASPGHEAGKPENAEQWFEKHYRIITSKNFNDLRMVVK